MTEIFLVYSTRMNAWIGIAGTGVSEISDAQHFTREAAMAFCKKQRDGMGRPISFPVSLDLIMEVRS